MRLPVSTTSAIIAAVSGTLFVSGMGLYAWKEEHRPPVLEVYIFPLAQGQSVFVRTPEDKRILINGGGNGEVIRHISKHLPFYSRRLDVLIATDTSAKQVAGLIAAAERYNIERAYVPSHTLESLGLASSTESTFKEFLGILRQRNIFLERMSDGDQVQHAEPVRIEALFPVGPDTFSYSRASPPETVLSLTYGKTNISLFGNTSRKVQKFVASTTASEWHNRTGESRILVMSHGAAPNAVSSELLESYAPDQFLYSQLTSYAAAKRKSGTPAQNQRGLFQKINIRQYEYVKITSDGNTHVITTYP
jgi:beta-lactamase superfamily II metal-dependent hydrolase